MITAFLILIVFFELITYLIIFDIILSWLRLFGLKWKPEFLSTIIYPLYSFVRKYIPTRIGAFDLTPIVIFILISFIQGAIFMVFPEVRLEYSILVNNL